MTMNYSRRSLLWMLASAAAFAGNGVRAQGFDVQRWDPRTPVPALEAVDLNGRVWKLKELGGKAVLINFWASWCEPCRVEMPSLQDIVEFREPQKLVVLAVNFKESSTTATQFVRRTELKLPVLLDPQGAIARQWGVKVFPTTVLIGSDGRVHAVVRGEVDWLGTEAARLIAPLL